MVIHKPGLRRQTNASLMLFLVVAALLTLAALVVLVLNWLSTQPASTPVTVPVSAINNFSIYQDKAYGYQISYPKEWHITDRADGAFTASAVFDPGQAARGGTNFSQRRLLEGESASSSASLNKLDVLAFDLDQPITAQAFMAAKSGQMPVGRVVPIQVAGQEALKVEAPVAQALTNHTDNTTYTSVFVTVGKHGYIIAGVAPASVFDQIVSSFHPL